MTHTRRIHAEEAVEWRNRADELERTERLADAIEALVRANRLARDAAVERKLVRLRHEAFLRHRPSSPPRWPVVPPEAGPAGVGPLVLERDQLSPQALSTGIARYGSVHVRGLIEPAHVDVLVSGIDQAFDALAVWKQGATTSETTPWYEPFRPSRSYKVGGRKWVVDNDGIWTGDSPRMLFELLEAFEAVGLVDVITRYLGERPALSLNKSTLKRVPLGTGGEWHQDGAFLGQGIRTVNVWLALSHCGRDAPGLDIVPQRLDHIVETATEGAQFSWSVGPGLVEQVATLAPVTRPTFEPGDALLFDELFLHRTAADDPGMHRARYAVETWFFAPSVYPRGLVPLLV